MPKIAEIEDTPNPNAKKFILREPLTWGVARSFDNATQAAADPLAARLFEIAHVTSVFYVDHWITVSQDGKADWQPLLRELAVPIRDAAGAEAASTSMSGAAAALVAHSDLSPEDAARLDRINTLLDEQVRPFLQGDGGDLYVVGLQGNTLQVHYQGACGSCPSSLSGTLAGIEGLVRSIEPDMEVIAV